MALQNWLALLLDTAHMLGYHGFLRPLAAILAIGQTIDQTPQSTFVVPFEVHYVLKTP